MLNAFMDSYESTDFVTKNMIMRAFSLHTVECDIMAIDVARSLKSFEHELLGYPYALGIATKIIRDINQEWICRNPGCSARHVVSGSHAMCACHFTGATGLGSSLAVTTLSGRLAHFNVGLVRCLSLHEHDAGCAPFKFGGKRSTHSHTVSTNVLRNGLSTWSPPPSCKMDWMD